MLRLLGLLISVVFAIAVAIVTWPGFFHLEQTFPIAQLVAARGAVTLGLLVLAVLALLLSLARSVRGFAASIALIALVGAGANAVIIGSHGIGSDTLPTKTDASVRVMTWNTKGEATSGETIAKTAVAMQADVVALPETSAGVGEQVAESMRELGTPMWVHHVNMHRDVVNGPKAWETTILISPRLGDYRVAEDNKNGANNTSTVPSIVAKPVSGSGPTIVAVHAVAPRPADMRSWQEDLRWIARQCASGNVILAGDFNATIDHMSDLGKNGATLGACVDAAQRTGNGSVGTWPTQVPALLGTPIDHVMATQTWRATGSVVLRSLDDSGSDHRPLIAQLEPAK